MKLNLKDEPKEWRKSALLAVLGLVILSSLSRWRQVLAQAQWLTILALLSLATAAALRRPRWFRGYHLFSMRLGFAFSRVMGRLMLWLFFLFILTPLGWVFRRLGKDPLQLKRPAKAATYWQPARECNPLDRLF